MFSDPANVQKITDWPVPACVTDGPAVLGMGNYYRQFIQNCSKKIQSLIQLTKKEKSFECTEECKNAFDLLKEVLTDPDIMAYPMHAGEFILDTDTSLDTVGAILSQVQNGAEWVIAYGSRTLSKQEQNYCLTDCKLLAAHFFMEYYKLYMLGRHFVVQTAHQALKWLYSLQERKDRIAWWLQALSAYQFAIEYHPGNKHGNADGIFQMCPNPLECKCPLLEEEEVLKCGLCKTCCRRASTMDSTLIDSEGLLQAQKIQVWEEVLPTFDNPAVWVQTHSQTKSMEAKSAPTQVEHPEQSKQ